MKFLAAADTDIGILREANQDSMLIRHAKTKAGEVLLCVLCDGMGGLSRGELASATVIWAFSDWFDRTCPGEACAPDLKQTAEEWKALLTDLNRILSTYGQEENIRLGTTFSGIFFAGGRYLICHVGDSRIYHINRGTKQLTSDQTLAAQEVRAGRLTKEQAAADGRRSILLQCIGASASIRPQVILKKSRPGVYLLCSDGLCHEITAGEMQRTLQPSKMTDRHSLYGGARHLIDQAKARGETDNVSAVVVLAKGAGRCHG